MTDPALTVFGIPVTLRTDMPPGVLAVVSDVDAVIATETPSGWTYLRLADLPADVVLDLDATARAVLAGELRAIAEREVDKRRATATAEAELAAARAWPCPPDVHVVRMGDTTCRCGREIVQ